MNTLREIEKKFFFFFVSTITTFKISVEGSVTNILKNVHGPLIKPRSSLDVEVLYLLSQIVISSRQNSPLFICQIHPVLK